MSALIDAETVVLEQLDFEPPCQIDELLFGFEDGCPAAGTHLLVCTGCGPVLSLCDGHSREWLGRADASDRVHRKSRWNCRRCGVKAPKLRQLFTIQPMPGGAS